MTKALVYVVDDDDAVRGAVQLLLCAHGLVCKSFGSANACLAAMADESPDCLLLDLQMPQMNGAELAETVASRQPALPMLVMTGDSHSGLAERARHAGVRAILDKPLNPQQLVDCIDSVVAHA